MAGERIVDERGFAALSPAERLGRSVSPVDGDLAMDDSDGSRARSVGSSGFGGGNSMVAYTTKSGDTLSSVASRYGVSTTELARVNRISSTGELQAGQELRIPAKPALDRYVDKPVRKSSYRAKTVRPKSKSSKPSSKPAPKKSKKRH